MNKQRTWIYDLLLIAILLLAAWLRLTGVNWGEGQHQHPDELFLSGVLDNLHPKKCLDASVPIEACPPEQQRWLSLLDYFNTDTSPLNPHNRGFSFFVYGTLPLFIVRYTAEWLGQTDPGALKILGRQFSALADLGTLLLLYFIVSRLYQRRTALLATLFSALAVMQIQQSHFFTTDLFVNLFMFLGILFAVNITRRPAADSALLRRVDEPLEAYLLRLLRHPDGLNSLGFGLAVGMAMASKINALPVAMLLPGAFLVRYLAQRKEKENGGFPDFTSSEAWTPILIFLVIGGLASVLAFRIFQPYAFDGIGLNPKWLANIAEQRAQANGDADLPWNLQWARRSHLYSFENLTLWGLGLPLGLLAWAGFLWMGWRILNGEWEHALLWGWTAFYFTWQSLQFNPTMRYQLPIYPLLAMMAAWVLSELGKTRLLRILSIVVGGLVLALTAVWAFAFHSIYLRPEPRIAASRWIYQNVPGPINLRIQTPTGDLYNQPLPFPSGTFIAAEQPYETTFIAQRDGLLTAITLGHVADLNATGPQTLRLLLTPLADSTPDSAAAQTSLTADFAPRGDRRGETARLVFNSPVPLTQGQPYSLRFETSGGLLTLSGASIANETDYDYGLPFRVDGYDGFGGIYRGDLNLQVYWDDNSEKLNRFVSTLSEADYIFIPTNHQYGQITRLPERYPLTTVYYRALLGCPAEENIIWCYQVAEPGMFHGTLGFDLVAVFEDYPRLGPLVINDQRAEEAFTFYDHPKVFIFQKRADFDPTRVQAILGAVDLSHVVHLTPRQASRYKDLLLPPDRLAAQRAGGTWSELFSYGWVQNAYPLLGLLLWYAFIAILGLAAYPLARLAFAGLGDRGYPLSRAVGLIVLAYLSWLSGSLGLGYTRFTIGLAFGLIVVSGLGLGWMRRAELRREWQSNRRYYLLVEGIFLAFFLFDLLIRIGNPDLWHPAKGGERPMDFSYFNAILKSTSFPPYDPWFAGGYINYYYYGFVLVGTPVKLLGIVPSIAYNFILPTLFALVAVGAFAIVWNLVERQKMTDRLQPLVSGLAAAILMVVAGNLGTVRMLFQGFQRLAAPGGVIDNANVVQRWIWAIRGFFLSLSGTPLPFGRGDWYWLPSRVIPAPNDVEPITEFPFFTFLYSDLHAHMIVIPIALLTLAWALALIKGRAQFSRAEWVASLALGGLVLGALYPTNLSDIYTYLAIAIVALAFVLWFYGKTEHLRFLPGLSPLVRRVLWVAAHLLLLVGLSYVLYEPYRYWYSQAYGAVDPWKGSHTPIWSYLTHWGVFLFVIVCWMTWETRQWMASTPVSALVRLRRYSLLIETGLAVFLALLFYLALRQVQIGWLALPLAVWAGILLLRPDLEDEKRLVLFWVGTALLITIVVEVVVVRGDIGRMNTVFKFYLQAWALLAVSAAAAFGWLLPELPHWSPRWRSFFQSGAGLLLGGALLFTITATADKIADRMAPNVPLTLDSMTYMNYAQLWDGETMDLSQDYRAIRWMQDHVQGSPVIVEANVSEYRWGTRYTIYTGLPGVVGWNWHQRQQRALLPPTLVTDRVDEINAFYNTNDPQAAVAFLQKYDVKYIIVGQFERILYPDGLAKFEQYEGRYWKAIYRDGETVIYEVLP